MRGALAMRFIGRLLGRMAAGFRFGRVLKGRRMIPLGVALSGGFVRLRGQLVVFGSFSYVLQRTSVVSLRASLPIRAG